jgi:biopolymer transport protein TolR
MVTEKENLTVTIDRETQIYINDFQVRMDFLKDKLEKILAGQTDREVFFRADKDVPYGVVVSVMAEIKAAGVDRLGMVTDPFDDHPHRTTLPVKKADEKETSACRCPSSRT